MKKILSIVLSLLVVFTFIPVATLTASAEVESFSVTNETDLAACLSNNKSEPTKNSDLITLMSDITITSTVTKTDNTADVIDTNGYNLIFAPTDDSTCMLSVKGTWPGALTIRNTGDKVTEFVNETDKPLFINTRPLTIGSGLFKGDIVAQGNLTIGAGNSATYPTIDGDITSTGTTLNIYEGVIKGNVTADYVNMTCTNVHESSVNEVEGNITSLIGAVTINRSRTLTVKGDITSAASIRLLGVVQSDGKITAGEFGYIKDYGTGAAQKTVINGDISVATFLIFVSGTLNGAVSCDGGNMINGTVNGAVTTSEEFNVIQGTFKLDPETMENLSLKGPSVYDVENAVYNVNTEGYKPVELGGEKYATFTAALSKAVAGDTIKLVDDYIQVPNGGYIISLNKDDITIDLNGYDVTDLSDYYNTGTATNFIQASVNITKFKLTSTAEGDSRVVVNSSDGSGQTAFRFNRFNDTAATELTFENFDFLYTGGEGNNRTFMTFSGTSTLDNVVNFNNVTIDNNHTTGGASTGCNGISCSAYATYNFTDCDIYSDRSTISCSAANSVYNFKNTTVDAGKGTAIGINSRGVKVNIEDCDMLLSRKRTNQHARLIATSRNTERPQITIKNSTLTSNANAQILGCSSTTDYVGADVTIEDSKFVNTVNPNLIGIATGDKYSFKGCSFETTSASTTTGDAITASGNVEFSLEDCDFLSKSRLGAFISVTGDASTSVIDLNKVDFAYDEEVVQAPSANAVRVAGTSTDFSATDVNFKSNNEDSSRTAIYITAAASTIEIGNASFVNYLSSNKPLMSNLASGKAIYTSSDFTEDTLVAKDDLTYFSLKTLYVGDCKHFESTATCVEDGVCTYCNLPVEKLGHDFTVAQFDETNHWNKCSRCDETDGVTAHTAVENWTVTLEPTCTEEGTHVKYCTDCKGIAVTEQLDPLGHEFTVQQFDATNHWDKCLRCEVIDDTTVTAHTSSENWTVTLEPTCTEEGTHVKYCTICGGVSETEQLEALGHEFTVQQMDATNHWNKCYRCEVIDDTSVTPHTSSEDWTVTLEPTCTEEGTHVKYCTVCKGVSETEQLVALGHDFEGHYVSDDNETCVFDCTETAKCSRCDVTDTREIAGTALGHNFVDYVSDDNATCEKNCTETAKCSRCDVTDTRDIEGTALGHNLVGEAQPDEAETCENNRTKKTLCDRCGEWVVEEVPGTALGHDYAGDFEPDKAATCVDNATEKAYCNRCEEWIVREVADTALGHEFTVLQTDETNHWYKCSRCNEIENVEAHTPEVMPAVAETCTETGLTEGSKCSVCDEILVAQVVIPNKGGHQWNLTQRIDATCTEYEIRIYTCSVCGETRRSEGDELDSGNHKPANDWTVTKVATCTANGTQVKYCTDCNRVVETKTINKTGHKLVTKNAKKATYFAAGNTGDKVCTVCGRKTVTGKKIAKLKLKKPVIKTKAAKKSVTVKFKKITGAKKYQIKYRVKGTKKWKTKTVSKTSYKLKKLNSGKKYQIRVRAMTTSGSKKAYSSYSKTKTVTVK